MWVRPPPPAPSNQQLTNSTLPLFSLDCGHTVPVLFLPGNGARWTKRGTTSAGEIFSVSGPVLPLLPGPGCGRGARAPVAGDRSGGFPLRPLEQALHRGEVIAQDKKPGNDENPSRHHGHHPSDNTEKHQPKAGGESQGFPQSHLCGQCSIGPEGRDNEARAGG